MSSLLSASTNGVVQEVVQEPPAAPPAAAEVIIINDDPIPSTALKRKPEEMNGSNPEGPPYTQLDPVKVKKERVVDPRVKAYEEMWKGFDRFTSFFDERPESELEQSKLKSLYDDFLWEFNQRRADLLLQGRKLREFCAAKQ